MMNISRIGILMLPLFLTACSVNSLYQVTETKNKDDDKRPSEESEGIPGYLTDLALINFSEINGFYLVKGEPGAVVTDRFSTTDLFVNILQIPVSTFQDVYADVENAMAEAEDGHADVEDDRGADNESIADDIGIGSDDSGNNDGLPPDEQVNLRLVTDEDHPKLYGLLRLSVKPNLNGGFEAMFKKESNDPLVVAIGELHPAEFIKVRSQNTQVIVGVFFDPTGQLEKRIVDVDLLEQVSMAVETGSYIQPNELPAPMEAPMPNPGIGMPGPIEEPQQTAPMPEPIDNPEPKI